MGHFLHILALPTLLVAMSCIGKGQNFDREPAVAGSFYPATKAQLTAELNSCFIGLSSGSEQSPIAIIVPHAGYVFSGRTAAQAFAQIDREARFKRVFIIGSSHTMHFNGAAIYPNGNYITPLGKVKVDGLARELIEKYAIFSSNTQPHQQEHSIEIQLPFLQYWLKNSFSIVPIVIGGESTKTCNEVANALAPYLNAENLFVISSDFSHYPTKSIAEKSDEAMANAICSNSVDEFLSTKHRLESAGHPNLLTAMCGWTSMLTLLYITQNQNNLSYKKIAYCNSANSPYGDSIKVVGYNAIALYKGTKPVQNSFELTNEAKQQLLALARSTIEQAISNRQQPQIDTKSLNPQLLQNAGAFVTLSTNGNLRGCIGNFSADSPLYLVVREMAIAAALHDYRFSPLSVAELDKISIEISVLTPMRRIKSADELQLGKHGIYMQKGSRSGTFLPQVATETGWNKEQFLGYCSRDKAGIGWNGWQDPSTELYVYEAIVFNEGMFK